MKTFGSVFILLILITLILVSAPDCINAKPVELEDTKDDMTIPEGIEVPALPSSQSGPEKLFKDALGNRIDYGNPELYLNSGTQSDLNEQYLNEIKKQIITGNNVIENIGAIFKWKQNYFKTYAAGGKFIGKLTVNQIMAEKALSGCHDHGLVLVSVLRKYKFPAIMVDTAGIQWALDYAGGKRNGVRGHVFIEVHAEDKWILINSTSGEYVENYDPCNPIIPMTDSAESKGYYALFKGLDPQSYGIDSNEELTERLKTFAGEVKSISFSFPQYKVNRF